MTLTKNLFAEIKASLSNKNENSYKDIMKFEAGKTYLVRLVPNINEPKKTIYNYKHHSWKSHSNGQFITSLCPSTYGESCPIDNYVMKTYNTGTEEEKKNLEIPKDLIQALTINELAIKHFESFPYSHKKEYCMWIGEAKTVATRTKRIAQAVEWIAEGKDRNWKYKNC